MMMRTFCRVVAVLALGGHVTIAFSPCSAGEPLTLPDEPPAMTIAWDPTTRVLIQPHGGYGRMIRLPSGNILCGYSVRGTIFVRHSRDNGRSWESPIRAADFPFGQATNTELLRRADGAILLFFNQRPTTSGHCYAIASVVSHDEGRSWSDPRVIYRAGETRRTGCWEPAGIELPTGEIQLFFANEAPYPASMEQEITMLRSFDGGDRWSAPQTVAFRAGHRDGMPVPLVLADGQGFVLAIEDNGLHGRFKPAIVHSPRENAWQNAPVGGDDAHRWSALARPLPEAIYAGAPYIRQFPCGTTVLSVQSALGRPMQGTHDHTHMVVYVGDASARRFQSPSVPFDIAPQKAGLWNSLFIKDERTVTAISGTYQEGVQGLWAIDGHLVPCAAQD